MKEILKKGLCGVLLTGVLAGGVIGISGSNALAVGDYEKDYVQSEYNTCSYSASANASQVIITWNDLTTGELEQKMIDRNEDLFGHTGPLLTSGENKDSMEEHIEYFTGYEFYHVMPDEFTEDELLLELKDQLENKSWNVPFLIDNEDITNIADGEDDGHYMNVIDVNMSNPDNETVTYHDGNYYHKKIYEDKPLVYNCSIEDFKDALEKCSNPYQKGMLFRE